MPVVIDVSAIVPLAFADEPHEYAEAVVRAVADDGGAVPALFWYEVWNTLAVSERRRRCTAEKADYFLSLLKRMMLATSTMPSASDVLGIARTQGLSAYDESYLELSLRLNAPLATTDKALILAAQSAKATLFAESDP